MIVSHCYSLSLPHELFILRLQLVSQRLYQILLAQLPLWSPIECLSKSLDANVGSLDHSNYGLKERILLLVLQQRREDDRNGECGLQEKGRCQSDAQRVYISRKTIVGNKVSIVILLHVGLEFRYREIGNSNYAMSLVGLTAQNFGVSKATEHEYSLASTVEYIVWSDVPMGYSVLVEGHHCLDHLVHDGLKLSLSPLPVRVLPEGYNLVKSC